MPPKSLVIALATLACCCAGAQVPNGSGPHENDPAANTPIELPFVSVRAIEDGKQGRSYYGAERGESSAGICTVDLDARKKRQIIDLRVTDADEVLDRLGEASGSVVVYVHGYNKTFEQSCHDAALLQAHVGLEGRLLLFTWPAEGKVAGYLGDVGDIAWSAIPLRDLLLELVNRFGSQNVDVIGHSLGAKGTVDAIIALGELSEGRARLGRAILIAPDLDGDVFIRDYERLASVVTTVTVYVSAQDRALKASRNVRDEPRLGEGFLDLSALDGIDVVEVSQKRWRFGAGHNYHLNDATVGTDLSRVLSGSPRRFGWREIVAGQNP
jgi:esterase/lipase superfamily enzyme